MKPFLYSILDTCFLVTTLTVYLTFIRKTKKSKYSHVSLYLSKLLTYLLEFDIEKDSFTVKFQAE